MIHPHTELKFISETIGYGVVATRLIPKGTITWAKDKLDRSFKPKKVASLDPIYQEILEKYCYIDRKGKYVLCWDISRYVNHSFNSNCLSTPYDFEIAIRDIQPGEELTDDYGYLNVIEPFECVPEPGTNRTKVMPDDLLNFHHEWDEKLKDAFCLFNSVEQPLKSLLKPEILIKSENICRGQEKMKSILHCYYDRKKVV